MPCGRVLLKHTVRKKQPTPAYSYIYLDTLLLDDNKSRGMIARSDE